MDTKLMTNIEALLKSHNHERKEIKCILWGDHSESWESALSIDVDSFWRYAENVFYDYDCDWATGPHYPLQLLSGQGWWIESDNYDSRTTLVWREEPKVKELTNSIGEHGGIVALGALKEITYKGE